MLVNCFLTFVYTIHLNEWITEFFLQLRDGIYRLFYGYTSLLFFFFFLIWK